METKARRALVSRNVAGVRRRRPEQHAERDHIRLWSLAAACGSKPQPQKERRASRL